MTDRDEKATIDAKALQQADRFFSENKQAIADYAQRAGFSFEPADQWSIDFSTRRGTFDPGFFFSRGFTAAESMWAVCHEIEHFRDWRKAPEAYARLYNRIRKGRKRLRLLYEHFNDIAANREEDRRFPAHWETRAYLYTYKLMPRTDHSMRPRHLQFVDAILRERILPDQEVILAPEVRTQVEKLSDMDGEGTDLIDLASDPSANAGERFDLIQDYVEPIYERFFREDVEDRRRHKKNAGDSLAGDAAEANRDDERDAGESEIEVDDETEEDYFTEEYQEMDQMMPQVMSTDEIRQAIDQEITRLKEGEKTPEQLAREQFKALYGVSAEEVEDYAQQYGKIERYIDPLRAVFERVIAMRKEVRRRLKERTDQGVIVDPSLMVQAYIDARSGIIDSRTQLNMKRDEVDEHRPLDFEFTLICDLSGSMNEEVPGGKSYEQRLCTVLITEALDEFEKKLRAERLEKVIDLQVFTEVRGFGAEDEELKGMSGAIDYYTRVKISRRLASCVGRRTADYKSLAKVASRLDTKIGTSLEDRDLKKAVVLITDGGSDDVLLTREAKNRLADMGVVAKAIQVGEPSNEDVDKFRRVWGNDGLPCKDVSRLVPTMEKLLEELLEDL